MGAGVTAAGVLGNSKLLSGDSDGFGRGGIGRGKEGRGSVVGFTARCALEGPRPSAVSHRFRPRQNSWAGTAGACTSSPNPQKKHTMEEINYMLER